MLVRAIASRAIEKATRGGLIALAVVVGAPDASAADEAHWFGVEYRAVLGNEPTYFHLRDDAPLNRDNRPLRLPAISDRTVFDGDLKLLFGKSVDVSFRDRAVYLADDAGANTVDNAVIEAYLTVRLPGDRILEVGKRNVREGVGYGFTPVDFLRTPAPLTGADPDPARQREFRPGNYLVRLQGDAGPVTVSALYSPHLTRVDTEGSNAIEQVLLKVYTLIHGHDVSLYLYHGERWKGGAAWSTVIGQATELHAEGSVQRGSDVLVPLMFGSAAVPLFAFQRRHREDQYVVRLLVGGQYTFTNGLNVIGEYFYDGDGYTNAEFRRLFRLADIASARQRDPTFLTAGGDNVYRLALLDAASHLGAAQGQHLLFGRLAGVQLPGRIDVALFDIFSVQDASSLASVEISRTWRNLRIGIGHEQFFGARRSQFGLVPFKYDVRAFVRYFF